MEAGGREVRCMGTAVHTRLDHCLYLCGWTLFSECLFCYRWSVGRLRQRKERRRRGTTKNSISIQSASQVRRDAKGGKEGGEGKRKVKKDEARGGRKRK
jgi:hypothetical protein